MLSGPRVRRSHGDSGVVSVHLVLVVAFVMVAVIELTRTWFGAQHIAGNLGAADRHLGPIRGHTEQIQRLHRTTDLTAGIEQASEPLAGQARRVNRTADDIQRTVQRIRDRATHINARVDGITATAADIETTVDRILRTARSIEGHASSIEGHARGIDSRFSALLPLTQRIDGEGFPDPVGVDSIVRNADTIRLLVLGIHGDLRDVLGAVRSVRKHAVSIQHSPVVTGEQPLNPLDALDRGRVPVQDSPTR